MKEYNVEPTAEIIDEMVKELVYRSQRLEGVAKQMRQKNDLTYASEAVLEIVALLQNVRIDLMTTRPLRENYERLGTMKDFKEQEQYRLFLDSYNYILLTVSYIESNTIWLSNSDSCYKYDRKTERLYKWCGDGYHRVDTEYGFSKLSSDDTAQALWEQRQQSLVDYSGFYGD